MKKIAFLVNRTINHWEKVVQQIEDAFAEYDKAFYHTEFAGHLIQLASEVISEGFQNIIVVGGDGSINEALNGILSAHQEGDNNQPDSYNWEKLQKICIGIIPAGTGNDFSKTIGITGDIRQLEQLVRKDSKQLIDIGLASYQNRAGQPESRFFINITDVGMGGKVVEGLDVRNRLFSRSFIYNMAIARTFLTYKKSAVRCYNNDFSWEGKVMNLIVANGKYFGSGLGIAPLAEINDGKFALVILGDISLWDYISHLGQVKACKVLQHPEVSYRAADEVTITSTDGRTLPIDMDGEFIGYAPMTVVNLSQRLHFFM